MTPLEKAADAAKSVAEAAYYRADIDYPAIARAVISSIEVDDAMVEVGLNEALAIMREHGVDGLSPFEAYPSPAETTRRVLKAFLRSLLEGETGR